MTSWLERLPPVLLDSIVLGWLVAMVTLPWHSARPPEYAGMAEKGGVSPLVLFTGVTRHRQEAAHWELWLGLCGMETGAGCQVMPSGAGQNSHMHVCRQVWVALPRKAAAWTEHCLQISTTVLELLSTTTTPTLVLPAKPHLRIVFQWEATHRLHFLQHCLLCAGWMILLPLSSSVCDSTGTVTCTEGGENSVNYVSLSYER